MFGSKMFKRIGGTPNRRIGTFLETDLTTGQMATHTVNQCGRIKTITTVRDGRIEMKNIIDMGGGMNIVTNL